MTIEAAVLYGVALALPVWLLVEEVVHRELRRAVTPRPRTAPSTTRVPAARAA
jgi:hypothetical protein